jgi:hypothetical protein
MNPRQAGRLVGRRWNASYRVLRGLRSIMSFVEGRQVSLLNTIAWGEFSEQNQAHWKSCRDF